MEIKNKVEELKKLYYTHSPIYFHSYEKSLERGEIELSAFVKLCDNLHIDNIDYNINRDNITELRKGRGERQSHGFTYQKYFCIKNKLIEDENYTASFDAYTKNKQNFYSIKTMGKGGSLDFGDAFIRSKVENDFFLQVGVWENEKLNFVEEYTLLIPINFWRSCFDYELLNEIEKWLMSSEITNDRNYDKEWTDKRKYFKKKWGDRPIEINLKRDHQENMGLRLQCSISNSYFYNKLIPMFSIETLSIYSNEQ